MPGRTLPLPVGGGYPATVRWIRRLLAMSAVWCVYWTAMAGITLNNEGRIARECLQRSSHSAVAAARCRGQEAEEWGSWIWPELLVIGLVPPALILMAWRVRRAPRLA